MRNWEVIDTGRASAQKNMDIDQALLNDASNLKNPTIHFYEWEGPCATYGYFSKPEDFLDLSQVKKYGLNLGRRPTGGGIIFHLTDLAFSVIVPACHPSYSLNTLDNYALINRAVIEAIHNFTGEHLGANLFSRANFKPDPLSNKFCMAKPTVYDVMIDGKKVGGAAQRRTKHGFLHQGSISLALPPKKLLNNILIQKEEILKAMESCSYTLLKDEISTDTLQNARKTLRNLLAESLQR
ncbi:MAG: lipoate--protein ligase family protein [Chlamydiota bacterium]|nr:lipoate--protein ligase family protein [Chlamydiota bacterium]